MRILINILKPPILFKLPDDAWRQGGRTPFPKAEWILTKSKLLSKSFPIYCKQKKNCFSLHFDTLPSSS